MDDEALNTWVYFDEKQNINYKAVIYKLQY